jgi:dipeptidyl aminopeptidase/acylaminoacyl peptidase
MRPCLFLSLILCIMLGSCSPAVSPVTPTATALPVSTRTPVPTRTPYPTPTRAPTWTPEATMTPAESPYSQYSIEALRKRAYGGGQVEALQEMDKNKAYTRYVIRYRSDGLTIYGYACIPRGEGPYPVIIMLHGRSDQAGYSIFAQDTNYAEMYAGKGYIVLHPNLRDYRPSDSGDNLFMVGMAVDVLNLIALVKAGAGQAGLLQHANPQQLGLWAYSMGGAIALRVLAVSPDVKAAFLYAPMSGDDYLNASFFAKLGDVDAQKTLTLPPFVFSSTSPQNFYKYITAAVDIHHGLVDATIPAGWSQKTCEQLKVLGKTVNCYFYPGMEHVFSENGGVKLKLRMSNFFHTWLKAPPLTATPTP